MYPHSFLYIGVPPPHLPFFPESRQHFIAECSAYNPEREVYAEKLRSNPVLPDELKRDLLNPELFTHLTLDASFYINGQENLDTVELHSREYIL